MTDSFNQVHKRGSQGDSKELHSTTFRTWVQDCQQLLTERFGDPHIITASYRKEIKQWPQIKTGDAGAYRRFPNF